MTDRLLKRYTAFDGHRRLAAGHPADVAVAVKAAMDGGAGGPLLTFDDATAEVVDLDLRGSPDDIRTRYADRSDRGAEGVESLDDSPRGRGRPRLGVVAREVTLLPRHWAWLAAQPGGASVTLRRLVDGVRRSDAGQSAVRARDAAYRFMSAMAGNLPDFEEATRALFAEDRVRFEQLVASWPMDLRVHTVGLAYGWSTGTPLVVTLPDQTP
ncbi:MAG TPA: DUF2239 family protein [Aliidongia sp.]|uniref:DUF2239 family protein n=1 Tax=Aliidongia sp. TaxID=1914230 RepID=UPI002DDD3A70|nr:DUF2239 family protein [Aliidongia sp.]HEV2674926.1 DUF2239 family protein [Aliidongia sp.]